MRTKLALFSAALALMAAGGGIRAGDETARAADARGARPTASSIAKASASSPDLGFLALESGCADPVVIPIDEMRFMVRCEALSGVAIRILVYRNPAGINDDIGPFRGSKAKTDTLPIGEPDEDWE